MERVDRLWMVTREVLAVARNRSMRIKHRGYYPRNSKMCHLGDDNRHGNLSKNFSHKRGSVEDTL